MVYIGAREYKYGRMIMSHMVADNLPELFKMAKRLGIGRKHFQNKPGKPHFDVCKQKKAIAVTLGATVVNNEREIIHILNTHYGKHK